MANIVGRLKGYHGGAKNIANIYDAKQSSIGETKVLLHFNGTTTDECGNTWTSTVSSSGSSSKVLHIDSSSALTCELNLTSTTYTIDYWLYGTGNPGNFARYIEWVGNTRNSHLQSKFEYNGGKGNLSSVQPLDEWTHIAIVNTSSKMIIFRNGVMLGTLSSSAKITKIGIAYNYYTNSVNGGDFYVADFRISNVARWTANFTPPTRGSVAKDSSTVAFMTFKTNTTDECGNTWTSYGSPTCEIPPPSYESVSFSTDAKFGTHSLYPNGNYIYTTPPELGSQDFTIDWWEYIPSSGASNFDEIIVIDGTDGTPKRALDIDIPTGTEVPRIWLGKGDGSSWILDKQIGTLVKDAWVHRAVTRCANTIYAFQNGTLYTSFGFSASISVSGSSLFVGGFSRDTRPFRGYLDEVRIVVGRAIWTADFTPPTSAYTANAGTATVSGIFRFDIITLIATFR